MAIAAAFEIPGMTAEQYDRVVEELAKAGHGAPDGRTYHVAWQQEGGWSVLDVWESPEKLETFGEVLMPILQAAGVTPTQPKVSPVHNVIVG